MLTYLDGGAHTCCVYDGEGNTGCDRTEIFIKGVCVVFVCVCVCAFSIQVTIVYILQWFR